MSTATAEDVDYLLEAADFAIPDAGLATAMSSSWAGLRPLVEPDGDLARERRLPRPPGR